MMTPPIFSRNGLYELRFCEHRENEYIFPEFSRNGPCGSATFRGAKRRATETPAVISALRFSANSAKFRPLSENMIN